MLFILIEGCWLDEGGDWIMYEPEGATCSNGSQYRFFVEFSDNSDNVIIFFEGGGACWDYESCSNRSVRSSANRNGIPETHVSDYVTISGFSIPINNVHPVLRSDPSVTPTHDWNKVFVPYCTGDVHSGARNVVYSDPMGVEPELSFRHQGRANVLAVLDTIEDLFISVPKLMVGGCSAGGVGAMINYDVIRRRLNPDQSFLLNDSGPIFPENEISSRSKLLYTRVRTAWGLDRVLLDHPRSDEILSDFGAINTVLANIYPEDRFVTMFFQLDYNFALYSYERFYTQDEEGNIGVYEDGSGLAGVGLNEDDPEDRSATYRLWGDDTELLRAQYDEVDNLAYYLPFYRETSNSHCLVIPGFEEVGTFRLINMYQNNFERLAWLGTEIETAPEMINAGQFLSHFVDGEVPPQSFFEEEPEGDYLSCVPDREYYDKDLCAQTRRISQSSLGTNLDTKWGVKPFSNRPTD